MRTPTSDTTMHDDGYEMRPLRKSTTSQTDDAIIIDGIVADEPQPHQQQQAQRLPVRGEEGANDGCCCRYHPRDRTDGCTTATATMTMMTSVGTARDVAATAASPGGISGLWSVLRPSTTNLNTICSALSPVMIFGTAVWFFMTEHSDSAAFARFARRVINCSLHVESAENGSVM